MSSNNDWRGIAYHVATPIYAAVAYNSDKGASSPTGETWTARALPSVANWGAICASVGITKKFVAVASGTTGASSDNGTSWTARTLSESGSYKAVARGTDAGVFIALANGNTVNTKSTDGETWADTTLFTNVLWQQYGNRIRWSLSSDMRNFTNVLNYIDLPEQNGEIISLLSDGQRLIAYLNTAIYYAVSTGDATLPFSFLKLETAGIGLIAQQAVCRIPNGHVFVGLNGIYLMTNLTITAIGAPVVDVTIRKLKNPAITECYYNETRNIVFFAFAVNSATHKDQKWALNLDTKSWSMIEDNTDHLLVNGLYVADSEGPFKMRHFEIYSDGTAKLQQGEIAESSGDSADLQLITGDLDFGDGDQVKEFFRIKFNIDENEFGAVRDQSLLYTISYSTDFGVTYKQIPGQLRIPVGQQEGYLTFRAIGNYIRFKIVSTSAVAPYTITSYTVDLKLMQPQSTLQLSGGRI